MTAFSPAGSGGAPLDVTVSQSGVVSPLVYNLPMTLAATEYSYAFPAGTKKFLVQGRFLGSLQVSYLPGDSGVTYLGLARGVHYSETDLDPTTNHTIYIQSGIAGQVLEILSWS